jgi:hypothetical protein
MPRSYSFYRLCVIAQNICTITSGFIQALLGPVFCYCFSFIFTFCFLHFHLHRQEPLGGHFALKIDTPSISKMLATQFTYTWYHYPKTVLAIGFCLVSYYKFTCVYVCACARTCAYMCVVILYVGRSRFFKDLSAIG